MPYVSRITCADERCIKKKEEQGEKGGTSSIPGNGAKKLTHSTFTLTRE